MAGDIDAAHGDIGGQDGVNFPLGRIDDVNALDEHVAAPVRLDEIRTKTVVRTKNSFGHGRAAGGGLD